MKITAIKTDVKRTDKFNPSPMTSLSLQCQRFDYYYYYCHYTDLLNHVELDKVVDDQLTRTFTPTTHWPANRVNNRPG